MKRTLITSFALLSTMPAALAWPFASYSTELTNSRYTSDAVSGIAFQADSDATLEFFGGGPEFVKFTRSPLGGFTAAAVPLPLPDKDPYAASLPNADFNFGRGAVGDMDGDGDTDIVYSCSLTYNGSQEDGNVRIVVCRNEGNGSWSRIYQMKDTSATHGSTPDVKLADFDGDGDLDMAETHEGLRIYWNDGTGVFPTATANLVSGLRGDFAPRLAVADFDRNGWPDVILAGEQSSNGAGRVVLVSNSAGSFSAATLISLPNAGQRHFDTAAADVDSDGWPDFLTLRQRSAGGFELVLHTNNGGGSFAAPLLLTTATNPTGFGFQVADLDQDGVMDILFGRSQQDVRWLRRTGTGSFAEAPQVGFATSATGGGDICAADIDGDGDVDVIPQGGGRMLLNTAGFQKPLASTALYAGVDTPTGTVRLAVADVNGDGREDLLATDPGAKRVRWYAGNGAGLASSYPLSTGSQTPAGVTAGDYNHDGRVDIAWSTTAGTLERAQNNNGLGTLWAFDTLATMTGITEIKTGDMDRDGDEDILSISPSAGIMRSHLNPGSGAWSPQNVDSGLTGVSTFACAQWLPGGRPEVLSLTTGSVETHRHLNGSWTQNTLFFPTITTASRAAIFADLDRTQPGLEAVFTLGSNRVFAKNFTSATTTFVSDTGAPVTRMAAADWNLDGSTDLLAATSSGVVLFPGSVLFPTSVQPGCGVSPVPLMTGVSVQDVVIMDFNGDAHPDAVAVDSAGELHLITNRTAIVDVQVTGAGTVTQLPGTVREAATLTATGLACAQSNECAPSTLSLQFRRSNFAGGVDSPGTLLTAAEMAVLVDSIVLGNVGPGYANITLVPSGGSVANYTFNLNADEAGLFMTSGTGTRTIPLQVKLKPGASSSAVTRFYVEYLPASEWATRAVLNNATALNPTPARRTGTSATVRTLIVLDTPSLLDTWRLANFGSYDNTGDAANDADPDRDGIPNLVEYVTSQNPNAAGGLGSGPPLEVTFLNRETPVQVGLRVLTTYDSTVKLTIQSSFNMQSWSTLSTRTGTGAWSLAPASTTLLNGGGRSWFKFNASVVPQFTWKQYFRLKAEELP